MEDRENSFQKLGLDRAIIRAIKEKGYNEPTTIQRMAIPYINRERDIVAISQTGTGKTASFVLPIINLLYNSARNRKGSISSLILVPTRELAIQVYDNVKLYNKYTNLKVVSVLGGVNINPQMQALKGGADILIATPGRLLDLYDKNAITLNALRILVLDEADKLLDLGFDDEISRIFSLIPKKRQTLLFSATIPEEVKKIANENLINPEVISVDSEITTASTIEEILYPVEKSRKKLFLLNLIESGRWDRVLVFVNSQNRVNHLLTYLKEKGLNAESIHGGKTQASRNSAIDSFRSGQIDILVSTDIASRGIDISELPVVINYDIPQVPENYIHRIGRTGRAGREGLAISFCTDEDFENLVKIERKIQTHIKREKANGFEPAFPLKDSPAIKPVKPKKPKKNKDKSGNKV